MYLKIKLVTHLFHGIPDVMDAELFITLRSAAYRNL